MHVLLGILVTLIMLCVLVIVHEGGHFFMAKVLGVSVNEFSVGMGPLIAQKKYGSTNYSLRLLPIGGYVALEGENGGSEDPNSFSSKPWWAKILVLAMGPFMNFVLAVFIIMAVLIVSYGVTDILSAFLLGVYNSVRFEGLIFNAFAGLFTGGGSMDDLAGPVGMVSVVDDTVQIGMSQLMVLAAVISLNLGLINILPFPALDGGRILFVIIRLITGRAISDEMENAFHFVGISILFAMMILITFNDINKLIM